MDSHGLSYLNKLLTKIERGSLSSARLKEDYDKHNYTHVIKRLRVLLKKRYVVEALLRDPNYRVKLYLVAGLLGEDFLEDLGLLEQTE